MQINTGIQALTFVDKATIATVIKPVNILKAFAGLLYSFIFLLL